MTTKIKEPLFNYRNVENVIQILQEELEFPFVQIQYSALGGTDRVNIYVNISKDHPDTWYNGIFNNSRYAQLSINKFGTVEQFAGHRLKLRKFTAKNIPHMIDKINAIKEV